MERKSARRSTARKCHVKNTQSSRAVSYAPCFLPWAFRAISLRRSFPFLAPTAEFLSLEAFSNASKRSRSSPWPVTRASEGRSGESCLNLVLVGGGVKCTGLKPSSSPAGVVDQEKGEYGSGASVSTGARDTEISGTCAGAESITNWREKTIELLMNEASSTGVKLRGIAQAYGGKGKQKERKKGKKSPAAD